MRGHCKSAISEYPLLHVFFLSHCKKKKIKTRMLISVVSDSVIRFLVEFLVEFNLLL